MTKEKILEALQELIETLRSSNFEEPVVKKLWKEKYDEVTAEIGLLPLKDLEWLDKEHKAWMRKHHGIKFNPYNKDLDIDSGF